MAASRRPSLLTAGTFQWEVKEWLYLLASSTHLATSKDSHNSRCECFLTVVIGSILALCDLMLASPYFPIPSLSQGHTHLNAYPSPQPRPLPATSVGTTVPPGMPTPPMSNEYGPGVVSDVIRQLDLAAEENNRLRHTLQENNRILEAKVQEIQNCLESRDREKQKLQDRITHLERELQEAQRKREREMAQREELQRKSMPAHVENTGQLYGRGGWMM